MPSSRRAHPWWTLPGGAAVAAAAALLPWFKNHAYLRDFYDYGLVMAGAGRIDAGERPYVDFLTPIQTGLFLLNGWVQKLGGGNFQAMTYGAPLLTILAVGLLAGMFARRWSAGAAVALAGAVTTMSMSQHTIIWHNCVGTVCIAVATCGAAVAPVLRRSQWGWHGLVAGALVVGGINKLNAHLVAVCGVLAWALFSGFTGRAAWSRVALTGGFVLVCGIVLPVVMELGWTGASLQTWWYNVVVLPLGSRAGDFAAALHWDFYFTTRHIYYGPLPLPQLGAVGILATAAFAFKGIRTLGWRQSGWVIAAALFAMASGAGLLATNYEIAYVAMGAWFALIAALWLGFGLRSAGRLFYGGLIAPMLVVGALAWHSAWQGQRSQFGYSHAARSDYVAGETIAQDFSYLRGTRLPPELGSAMAAMAIWRASLPAEARATVFYGPGLEWLECVWPTLKLPGMPLWMHGGTSYGAIEEARLLKAFSRSGPYRHVLVPEARDHWNKDLAVELRGKYSMQRVGPVWFRYDKLPPDIVSWNPVEFVLNFGGNVDANFLNSIMDLHTLADGRSFIGASEGKGELSLTAPSYRAAGEAVLRRVPGKTTGPATVPFTVYAVAGEHFYPRWSAAVYLPPDQEEIVVPFNVDCGGLPLRFSFGVPPELDGSVLAGWRRLMLLHALDGPDRPPKLRQAAHEATPATAAMRSALLPAGWDPAQVFVRNGRVGPRGLELSPGGEIWIKLGDELMEFAGIASVAAGVGLPAEPVVRVLYYKGAKLDVQSQSVIRDPDRRFEFKAWSAEKNGWLAIMLDPNGSVPPVSIRLEVPRSN